jgi:hypothetical protein
LDYATVTLGAASSSVIFLPARFRIERIQSKFSQLSSMGWYPHSLCATIRNLPRSSALPWD